MLFSFIATLLVFVFIGALSTLKSKQCNTDYLLAGHTVSPLFVGLSAAATWCSGYMFIGMIGYTYFYGLHTLWLGVGFVFGDFIASIFAHKRMRVVTEATDSLSYGSLISRWHGTDYRYLRRIAGIITLIFLGVYAAAQFKAGGKALHVLLGWDYQTGSIIGSIIVLIYCWAGGIRASIWTDVAQALVMFVAMFMLLIVTVVEAGGLFTFVNKLHAVSPEYMDLFPPDHGLGVFGAVLFIAGWMCGGFSVIGQPHVMVRFMALDTPQNMRRARIYYYVWYGLFYAATVAVGLAARIYLPDEGAFDQELALPQIAELLLPGIFVGIILAGVFASTMSTADSQILSCSAAITRDILPQKKIHYFFTKLTTLLVTVFALMVALKGGGSVFDLVLIAVSVLASSFAPILFLYACGHRIPEVLAILMMLVGVATALLWRHYGLNAYLYEVAPGMLVPYLLYWLARISKLARVA